ncbi:MAG: hypothetical protein J6A59_03955 [Lachnospiraceae bacterium]|nr:hypothetical protein [Lachnospiraceae bacterium]
MSHYTIEEEKELNLQLKNWQSKLSKYILSDKWDSISEQLSEIELQSIKIINNANSHKDVNWLIWGEMDNIIKVIKSMYSKPTCFQGRLKGKRCAGETRKDGYLLAKCRNCKWNYYNQ